MINYHYACQLLSDVVITSSPATEGFPESLDYLPGAKFLGIAASILYNETDTQQTLDLFHNGTVLFGDAHPVIDGARSIKLPLSWAIDKDKKPEDGEVFQHHSINNHAEIAENGIQLKSLGGKYFQPHQGTYCSIDQDFRLKSAYNSALRKSEDKKMYGYNALPAGSLWQFKVASENDDLLKLVEKKLVGTKKIGRSRSAEYGLVEIETLKIETVETPKLIKGINILYAESNICLPPDFDGKLENLFPNNLVQVNYAKSKIRTRIYQSWNSHRHCLNADRLLIVKGSTLAIEVKEDMEAEFLLKGIGDYCVEGFGQILVNPAFMATRENTHFISISLSKSEENLHEFTYPTINHSSQSTLVAILKKRKAKDQQQLDIDTAVNEFVTKYGKSSHFRKTTASQWGTVRSFAKLFTEKERLEFELYNDKKNERGGYLVKGIAEEKWRSGKDIIRSEILEQKQYDISFFLQKIAAEMAKLKRKQK